MLLRPAKIDDSLLGESLPWDLYTSAGVLVLRAGSQISDIEHLHGLRARSLFRPADLQAGQAHPERSILDIIQTLDNLYEDPTGHDLGSALRHAAIDIITLYRADADASIGLARLIASPSRATRHCVLSALVSLGVGEHMEMSEADLETLTVAALSMNIAAMKLHNDLIDRNHLEAGEREAVAEHPGNAVNLLYSHGITDRDWLDAVFQHHENMDGSGYPSGVLGAEICLPARILRVADLYCAKISGRFYRPPRSSLFAMQYIFGHERRKIDTQIAGMLLRRYGFFPPGTLVTLSNQETAVVTRVQERKHALRHVVSFIDGRDRLLDQPTERDTQKPAFAVTRLAEARPDWPEIQWERVWGYA
jgi:HD-GYP domain-containing protein (c-di-GMP phosphodiesterase class II)